MSDDRDNRLCGARLPIELRYPYAELTGWVTCILTPHAEDDQQHLFALAGAFGTVTVSFLEQ